MEASKAGKFKAVKLLLNYGATLPKLRCSLGKSAMDYATNDMKLKIRDHVLKLRHGQVEIEPLLLRSSSSAPLQQSQSAIPMPISRPSPLQRPEPASERHSHLDSSIASPSHHSSVATSHTHLIPSNLNLTSHSETPIQLSPSSTPTRTTPTNPPSQAGQRSNSSKRAALFGVLYPGESFASETIPVTQGPGPSNSNNDFRTGGKKPRRQFMDFFENPGSAPNQALETSSAIQAHQGTQEQQSSRGNTSSQTAPQAPQSISLGIQNQQNHDKTSNTSHGKQAGTHHPANHSHSQLPPNNSHRHNHASIAHQTEDELHFTPIQQGRGNTSSPHHHPPTSHLPAQQLPNRHMPPIPIMPNIPSMGNYPPVRMLPPHQHAPMGHYPSPMYLPSHHQAPPQSAQKQHVYPPHESERPSAARAPSAGLSSEAENISFAGSEDMYYAHPDLRGLPANELAHELWNLVESLKEDRQTIQKLLHEAQHKPKVATDAVILTCIICFEDMDRCSAFIPCGHLRACDNCVKSNAAWGKTCVTCKNSAESELRLYLNS